MSKDERNRIINELKDWEFSTGHRLPLPAETIADYEAMGLGVDLYNHTIFDVESVLNQTVALSPQGLALYEAKCGGRIYAGGWPIEQCTNEHQRRGWMAALQADADAATEHWLATHRQAVTA